MTTTASSFAAMAFAATLLLASCSNSNEPVVTDPAASELSGMSNSGMELQTQDQQLGSDAVAAQGSGALNPAHGEPGHRCEIPVGAPLDGSGSNGASITIPEPSTAPAVSPITIPSSSPSMGTGMLNPAHGEPGHDCAVPVGSPLPG